MVTFRKISQRAVCTLIFIMLIAIAANIFILKASPSTTLRIEVVGFGDTDPAPGNHTYEYQGYVYVRAIPDEGYVFYQWELDGKRLDRNSSLIKINMNASHTLRVLFVKQELLKPLKSKPSEDLSINVNVGTLTLSECDLGFPHGFSYVATNIDSSLNEDMLAECSGGKEGNGNIKTIYLGGPMAIPFNWSEYGISFESNVLVYGGNKYLAEYGENDHAVILLTDNGQIRIAGITRYGTRAGLMWLVNNCRYAIGKELILLEWTDFNGNGEVDLWEVSEAQAG